MKKMVTMVMVLAMLAGVSQAATPSNAVDVAQAVWGEEAVALITENAKQADWYLLNEHGQSKYGLVGRLVGTMNRLEQAGLNEAEITSVLSGEWPDTLTLEDAVKLPYASGPHKAPEKFNKNTIVGIEGHITKVVYDQYDTSSLEWNVAEFNHHHNRRSLNKLIGKPVQAKVRKNMRGKGKGIVARDGKNPVADEMEPVVAALNAPMLRGLETAMLACP